MRRSIVRNRPLKLELRVKARDFRVVSGLPSKFEKLAGANTLAYFAQMAVTNK
jgi:hypothetical protein